MKKVISILAVVLILALSVMPVFAESVNSPKATLADYNIIIVPGEGGGGTGTYIYITGADDDGHQRVRFVATPDNGFKFTGWEFNGNYTTDGDLSQDTIELDITSDISATPKFEPTTTEPGATETPKPTGKPVVDDGSKSPQTGSSTVVVLSILALCAAAGAAALAVAKKAGK